MQPRAGQFLSRQVVTYVQYDHQVHELMTASDDKGSQPSFLGPHTPEPPLRIDGCFQHQRQDSDANHWVRHI